MSTLVAVLVRLTVIALALVAYYPAIPALFADARARGAAPTLVAWAAVAIAFGVLWLLAMTLLDPDDGIGLVERLRLDASTAVFTAGLVLVPAGVGAAIGGTVHRPG